jgi:hypothetical protein
MIFSPTPTPTHQFTGREMKSEIVAVWQQHIYTTAINHSTKKSIESAQAVSRWGSTCVTSAKRVVCGGASLAGRWALLQLTICRGDL